MAIKGLDYTFVHHGIRQFCFASEENGQDS